VLLLLQPQLWVRTNDQLLPPCMAALLPAAMLRTNCWDAIQKTSLYPRHVLRHLLLALLT
jgi:hypothetical protein